MKYLLIACLFLPLSSYASIQIEPTNDQVAARMAFYGAPIIEPTIELQVARYAGANGISADLFKAIASCESQYDPAAVSYTNDIGVMQINWQSHGGEVKQLGLNLKKVADNLSFAALLFKREGVRPWSASKPCWNRGGLFDG